MCPKCKEPWQVLPAISIDLRYSHNEYPQSIVDMIIHFCYRDNIESNYSDKVAQVKDQYTEEDKDVIKNFLKEKKYFLKPETHIRDQMKTKNEDIDQGGLSGNNVKVIHIMLRICLYLCAFITIHNNLNSGSLNVNNQCCSLYHGVTRLQNTGQSIQ